MVLPAPVLPGFRGGVRESLRLAGSVVFCAEALDLGHIDLLEIGDGALESEFQYAQRTPFPDERRVVPEKQESRTKD
jgi:hypothetical protein